MAISNDSKKYYERYRSRSLVTEELVPRNIDVTEESLNNTIDQNEEMFDDRKLAQFIVVSSVVIFSR